MIPHVPRHDLLIETVKDDFLLILVRRTVRTRAAGIIETIVSVVSIFDDEVCLERIVHYMPLEVVYIVQILLFREVP